LFLFYQPGFRADREKNQTELGCESEKCDIEWLKSVRSIDLMDKDKITEPVSAA
jgi:hypothetical protein